MNTPSSTPSNSLIDSYSNRHVVTSTADFQLAPIFSDRMYRIAALTAGIFLLATLL